MSDDQPKFGLARGVLGSDAFLPLSREEHAKLLAAKDLIIEVLAFEEKFDVVVSNLLELEKTLNDLAAEHMMRSDYEYHSLHDNRVLINQRVQNLLAACRLYLDHGAHHAGNMESAVPNLKAEFKTLTNKQYDESAAYRIAEALRNHSQHRGFSIGSFSTGGGWVERPGKDEVMLCRIEAHIDVEAIREDGKTKAAVLADIDKLDKNADVRPVLREYVERLSQIHAEMRGKLARPTSAFPGEGTTVGLAIIERDAQGRWIRQSPLSSKMIERRHHLLTRNDNLVNLTRRHVSSEPRN